MTKSHGIVSPLLLSLAALVASAWCPPARGGLDEYLKKPDPSFAWTLVESKPVAGSTVHLIKLTSQTWQGIVWTHNLSIVEPQDVAYPDAVLLFITGGKVGDGPRGGDLATGQALAKACRARVAVLPQVPNQPLLGGKSEDTLIAETFVRYLDTKDEEWPLLLPDGQERRPSDGRRAGVRQGEGQARRRGSSSPGPRSAAGRPGSPARPTRA